MPTVRLLHGENVVPCLPGQFHFPIRTTAYTKSSLAGGEGEAGVKVEDLDLLFCPDFSWFRKIL